MFETGTDCVEDVVVEATFILKAQLGSDSVIQEDIEGETIDDTVVSDVVVQVGDGDVPAGSIEQTVENLGADVRETEATQLTLLVLARLDGCL